MKNKIVVLLILLIIGAGSYFFYSQKKLKQRQAQKTAARFNAWVTKLPTWKYVNPENDNRLKNRSAAFAKAGANLSGSDVFFGIRCNYRTRKILIALWGPALDKKSGNNVNARIDFDRQKTLWSTFNRKRGGRVLLLQDKTYLKLFKRYRSIEITLNPNGNEKLKLSFSLLGSTNLIKKVIRDCKKTSR